MLFKKVVASSLLALTLMTATPAFAYEVKSGDTMYKIGTKHGMSLGELSRLNPEITNLDLIYPGQTVRTEANNTGSVQASDKKPSVSSSYSATAQAGEIGLLARLIHAEAQGESFTGKVAVAEVVLNRVADSRFPNTITGVIMQPGQFSPVATGAINGVATSEDVTAARQALSGSSVTGGAIYFYNSATASSRWLDSRPTVSVIGNHTFKR